MLKPLRASWRKLVVGHAEAGGPCAAITAHQLLRPEGPRNYRLARPTRPAGEPRPLVILLHGFGASGAQLLGQGFPPSPLSQWLEIAEREQLLLAAPDGTGHSWNDAFADARANARTDDCGFISALIDELIVSQGADPSRVYVMGVSKGGMLSLRLAAELGHRLAAVAPVLASMPRHSRIPLPSRPLPVLMVASSSDPLVRYDGGSFRKNRRQAGEMLGVEATLAIWRELAGLGGAPHRETLAQRHAGSRVTRMIWGDDPAGLQVGLFRIDGGGHAEPSPSRRYPRWINWLTGAQNADFETAEAGWAFFKDKRRAA